MSTVAPPQFHGFLETVKHKPIYVILGVQGSGTNLLRRILIGAFNFSVVKDGSVIYNAAADVGRNPSPAAVTRQFETIRSRVFPTTLTRKTRRLVKSNTSFDGIERHFDSTSIRSAAELARFVYAYGAFSLRTDLMAIKSDDLWERIDQIDAVLPNRRIILLTRDFRDNLLSISKKNFGPIEPLVSARYVKERFARYDAEYRRTPPANRYHVRYEDLLASPRDFLTKFSAHFGLEACPQADAALASIHIRQHNLKKWTGLDRIQLAQCEAILRSELTAYGYAPVCDPVEPPRFAEWVSVRSRDILKRIPQKLGGVAQRLRK